MALGQAMLHHLAQEMYLQMAKPDYFQISTHLEGLKNIVLPSYYAGNVNSVNGWSNVITWSNTYGEIPYNFIYVQTTYGGVRNHGTGSGSQTDAVASEPGSTRYFKFGDSGLDRYITFNAYDYIDTIKYYFIAGDSSNGLEKPDAGENIVIEVSADGGVNWTIANTIYDTTLMTSWTEVTDVISVSVTPTVGMNVRFRQVNSSGNNFDCYGLDNVRFYSNGTEIMMQNFEPEFGWTNVITGSTEISISVNNEIKIQETNDYINSNLILLYTFTEELTDEERGLFDYVSPDYVSVNPGTGTDIYISDEYYPFDNTVKANSYVGVYYDERTF